MTATTLTRPPRALPLIPLGDADWRRRAFCRYDPDKWTGRKTDEGEAVHGCFVHCPVLAECEAARLESPPRHREVRAGVVWNGRGPLRRQPEPKLCRACAPQRERHTKTPAGTPPVETQGEIE